MQKPLFAIEHKFNGTTEKRFEEAQKRVEGTYTEWKRLLDFYQENPRSPISFVLLAAGRRTQADVEEIAEALDLDPWEVVIATQAAEDKLARRPEFAREFSRFLDGFEGDQREQAVTVQDNYAMTYEEIGEKMGIAWQRVQQIEQEALAKLRADPKALRMLMEAR